MRSLAGIALLFGWILGLVLAKGFISTLAAILCPFWGWYLSVEYIFIHFIK